MQIGWPHGHTSGVAFAFTSSRGTPPRRSPQGPRPKAALQKSLGGSFGIQNGLQNGSKMNAEAQGAAGWRTFDVLSAGVNRLDCHQGTLL